MKFRIKLNIVVKSVLGIIEVRYFGLWFSFSLSVFLAYDKTTEKNPSTSSVTSSGDTPVLADWKNSFLTAMRFPPGCSGSNHDLLPVTARRMRSCIHCNGNAAVTWGYQMKPIVGRPFGVEILHNPYGLSCTAIC